MRSEVLTRWIWHRVVWQVDFGGTPCLNRQIRKVTRFACVRTRHQDLLSYVQSSWNVMAHGDAREGKWKGNWRMEWVASTLHTTSGHGVSSTTTADAHTSAASSRLNWRPRHFKWTRPFRRKTKSGFCACAITFQTQSTQAQNVPFLLRDHHANAC